MREYRMEIAGHTLVANEYNETLDTTPLIFVHGILATVSFGETALPSAIQEQFHWFSLSLPGHYPAEAPADFSPDDMTPDFMAQIMSEAVATLTGGTPAIIIGHSTGGYAGYCVAHHAPHLVDSLVMLSAFAVGKWHGSLGIVQAVARMGLGIFKAYFHFWQWTFPLFRFSFMMLGTDYAALRESELFQESARESYPPFKALDLNAIFVYFRQMPQIDIRDWLKEVTCPVRVIHGNRDRIIPPAHGEEMHHLLPNSQFIWIDGSGHLPMFERREAYEEAVIEAVHKLTKTPETP